MAKLPGSLEVKMQMQNLGFYLPNIRDGFGWSLDDVGERLGVSKQTVLNIEKQARKNVEENVDSKVSQIEKDCMTYAQYVTLRIIIEDEIVLLSKKDKTMAERIKFILCVLIDEDMKKLSEDDRKHVLNQNKFALMASVSNATTMAALFGALNLIGVISPLAKIGAIAAGVTIPWLKPWKSISKEQKNSKNE